MVLVAVLVVLRGGGDAAVGCFEPVAVALAVLAAAASNPPEHTQEVAERPLRPPPSAPPVGSSPSVGAQAEAGSLAVGRVFDSMLQVRRQTLPPLGPTHS